MTVCIYCCADVHVEWIEAHYRWHAQNYLHGVDCDRLTQANLSGQPTKCTCGLIA